MNSARPHSWYVNWIRFILRFIKFCFLLLAAYIVYDVLLTTIFTRKVHIFSYIFFWLFTAYVILPRVNRRIAKIYLPDYFIGRARTGDGLLGDPINLAFNGTEANLIACMEESGWSLAEPLTITSSVKMVIASVFGRNYPNAPVSKLFLFGNSEDLAFQRQIGDNPRKRHHVRFWKTPDDWRLPGGTRADWLAAATYDKNVGLSLFTGQITHKIDADVDQERDFLLRTLEKSSLLGTVSVIEHFTSSYHSRNGGGDRIHTDGSLPFVTIG